MSTPVQPLEGSLTIGDASWWAPTDGKAFERVKVTGLQVRESDGVAMVKTINIRTGVEFWNRETLTRALCIREPKRDRRKGGEIVVLAAPLNNEVNEIAGTGGQYLATSIAGFYPGFDPDHYRWWDRLACHHGHCHRGFDFHAMGLPHGQHVIAKAKASRAQSKPTGELFRTETGVALS